eukprot:3993096-Pyramimonas_sp.AAC.1
MVHHFLTGGEKEGQLIDAFRASTPSSRYVSYSSMSTCCLPHLRMHVHRTTPAGKMHRTTSEEWVEVTSREIAEELKAIGPSTTEELTEEKEPQCELNSPEERERLEQLRATLDPSLLEKVSEEMMLMTLRGRRYSVLEAAARLPLYLQLREDYKLDQYSGEAVEPTQ